MTLRNKIFVLIGMALTAILIVGGLGINSSLRLAAGIDEIGVVRLPSVLGLEMMSEGRSALQAANLSVFSYADAETASAALSRVDAQRKDIWRRIGRGWNIYEPLPQTPEEKVLWDRFVGEWKTWEQNDRRIGIVVAALAKAPTAEERLPLMGEYRRLMGVDASLFAVSGKTLDALVSLNVDIADAVVREKQADARRSYLLMSTLTMLSLVILAVGAGMITRSILRQVGGEPSVAVAIAEKIAAGDLTVHVPLRAGDSASMMAAMMNIQQGLLKIVSELRSGTQAIRSCSRVRP